MQDRTELTVYDNYQLKDQWEKRAQQFNDVETQEKKRKEKSALNGLFKQWQVDLAVRHGVADKKAKGGDISDFRKYVVKATGEDVDNYEVKIRMPPPPKRKPLPPPSPPPKLRQLPPPPKPRPAPKPKPVEKKPEPAKMPTLKKVEKPKHEPLKLAKIEPIIVPKPVPDNLSQAGWRESWKMLKSPHHKQQGMETKQESKAPKQPNDKMYKALGYDFEKQWGSPAESWKESWKQLKNSSEEALTEDMSFFEIISQGKWWRKLEEIENFDLPVWAGTWKTINFVLGQTKEAWEQEWPEHKREPSDKGLKAQTLEDKFNLSEWQESWKSSKPDPKPEKEKVKTELKIPNVFLPGWNDSWKTSDMCLQRSKDILGSMKDWRDSWGYCQEHKWCSASMESRYRHYSMTMSKRKLSNNLRGSLLDEQVPSEWMESWKSSQKSQPQSEEPNEAEPEPGVDMSEVPLHLQFHKTKVPFSTWRESWRVSCAHSEEKSSSKEWKNSWKMSAPNISVQSQVHKDVMCFSTEHKTQRYMGVEHAKDAKVQNEWSDSWKTTKPSPQPGTEQEQGEENVSDQKYDSKSLDPVVSRLHWKESWRFTAATGPFSSYSLTGWAESWRLANPNHPKQLDQDAMSHSYRQHSRKHRRYLQEAELPEAEWTNSWKYLKSDTLDPNMTREDTEEWGQCWRVLNPQLYMKKEAWCDQPSTEDSKDLRLQLSFLSKEDKKIMNLELSSSEWTESWRLPKQEH